MRFFEPPTRRTIRCTTSDSNEDILLRPPASREYTAQLLKIDFELAGSVGQGRSIISDAGVSPFTKPNEIRPCAVKMIVHHIESQSRQKTLQLFKMVSVLRAD